MMLSFAGACLTVLGALGTGSCICRERRRKIRQLWLLEEAFRMVAGEISYSRLSLPEVLMEAGEGYRKAAEGNGSREPLLMQAQLGEALSQAGRRLCDGSGADLAAAWQKEMVSYADKTELDRIGRELLLAFPHTVLYCDGARQQAAVTEFAGKLGEAARQEAQRERENSRVILAISAAGGLLAAILLV